MSLYPKLIKVINTTNEKESTMTYRVRRYEDAARAKAGDAPYRKAMDVTNNEVNNTSTSLQFVGEEIDGYSKFIFENFTWILENFSGEQPPRNAVRGQLWYRTYANTPGGEYYVYNYPSKEDLENGEDPASNGDSSSLANWVDVTASLANRIDDHLIDTDNPHQVTKAQVGLDNVGSGLGSVFDKAQTFGDIVIGTEQTIRDNLELYGFGEVYTKIESDTEFVEKGGDAYDAQILKNNANPLSTGIDHTALMKRAGPIANGAFNFNSVGAGDLISADGGDATVGIVGGYLTIRSSKNSTAEMVLTNPATNAEWNVNLYDGANALIKNYKLTDSNLMIGADALFHEGHPPTAADAGALALSGTAVDAGSIMGVVDSEEADPNTIVRRTASGDIKAQEVVSTKDTADVFVPADHYAMVDGSGGSTGEIQFADQESLREWFDISPGSSPAFEKAAGVFFPESIVPNDTTYGCSISKLAVGQFRVYFNSSMPSTDYVPIISESDYGALYPVRTINYGLDIIQVWVQEKQPAYFDIHIKQISSEIVSRNPSAVFRVNEYISRYSDTGRVSFAVYNLT